MRQQDIQKIIEQVEACKESLRVLARQVSERANDDNSSIGDSIVNVMVSTMGIGTDAQLDALKEILADINNK